MNVLSLETERYVNIFKSNVIGNLEDTSFLKMQELFNCINWKQLIHVIILFLGPEIKTYFWGTCQNKYD